MRDIKEKARFVTSSQCHRYDAFHMIKVEEYCVGTYEGS